MENTDTVLSILILSTFSMIGLCLGSFASAIAHRIATGQSWIVKNSRQAARSVCPDCAHQLSWIDLFPLFSWIFSLGRCRYCNTKISIRYPVIESCGAVYMAIIYTLDYSHLGLVISGITLPFVLAGILLIIKKRKIPLYVVCSFVLNIATIAYEIYGRI